VNKYDQLVNDFVLMKWKEGWSGNRFRYLPANQRDINKHLLNCRTTRASVRDAEWECGCYSEVTREDMFVVRFSLSCGCGCRYSIVDTLDLQHENLMEQLLEYEDNQCPYEDEDYPY
jgi:hypothetical protein